MLRKWNYREHYHPNLTEHDYTHWASHAGEQRLAILDPMVKADAGRSLLGHVTAERPVPRRCIADNFCVERNDVEAYV